MMERVELNESIKEVLGFYRVSDNVIKLIEDDQNAKLQALNEKHQQEIKKVQERQKKSDQTEFVEMLRRNRIVGK